MEHSGITGQNCYRLPLKYVDMHTEYISTFSIIEMPLKLLFA